MKKNKNIIMNLIIILSMSISYLILDLGLRFITYNYYKFYPYYKLTPNLFSLAFISLYIGIYYLIKKKYRKIFYIINILLFTIITYSQYLHFKIFDRFYNINDVFLAKEGVGYFEYAMSKTDFSIIIVILLSITLTIITLKLSKKHHEKYRDKMYFSFSILFTILCFISFFLIAYLKLGKETLDGKASYASSVNALDIYKDFNNPNKNIQVTGLYENTYREIHLYIKNKYTSNKESIKKIKKYLKKHNKIHEDNKYTGIFENKNAIVILMESIDSFLIQDEVMPTLNKLKTEGINFTNRYSPSFGGGQTLNSEFALNTGIYSSTDNTIYNLNNTYKTSLANMFKNAGYISNSIHYNNGYFYNRQQFHKKLGYEHHYAILDMNNIDNNKYDYSYDSNLIKSDKTYKLIAPDDKHLTFITTYSAHLPYDLSNKRCAKNKYKYYESDTELSCLYNLARDTDEMLRLLIERLKEDNKLDNTVLVLATDHYAYGYQYVNKIKNTNNKYLIQNTPLIIWNNNIKHEDIDTLADTSDILPTILNMFDIEYDPNLYVGEDIFSNNRDNYVYFDEDVYYDGKKLYDTNNRSTNKEIYNNIKEKIAYNKNLIKSNYLKETE